MRDHEFTWGARLCAAACIVAAGTAVAAPTDRSGAEAKSRPVPQESPDGREHRAGIQALLKGDRATAKARFEAALKLNPKSVPAVLGLAAVAQAEGQTAEVEKHLKFAESLEPRAPEVLLARARYHLARGNPIAAEASMKAAVEAAPDKLPPLVELGDFYLRSPDRKVQAQALPLYRKAVGLQPASVLAQTGLGMAAAVAGQRDVAMAAFGKAAGLAPKDPMPLQAIGRLHLEGRELDKALVAFDEGLKRQPAFLPLQVDRAEALGRLGRWPDAIQQLRTAEKQAPKSPEIQVRLGDAQQTAGRWPEAQASYLKAIELAPSLPQAYNGLAWGTVANRGDAKKAVEWARQAVSLAPNASPFHDTLGWAERAAGNLAGAQASLRKAIELEPNVAIYHYHLGVVLGEAKQNAEARTALKRAIELDGRMPEAERARQLLAALPPG